MILNHYLQLLSHYRRLLLILVASTTGAAALFSVLFLFIAPVYTGTASVVMLPTEAELSFTRGWLGFSQYNPANVISQTQMERMLSRPVAEKILSKLVSEIAATPPPTGLKAWVGSAFSKFRGFLRRTYITLNSGKFVPLSPYEDALQDVMKGLEVEMIEGSYVLQIEVTLPNPAAAAAAANALAEGYDEMIAEQSIQAAARLSGFLKQEIASRRAQIDSLSHLEIALRGELRVMSLNDEQQYLLNAIENERQALAEAQIELGELGARMSGFRAMQGDVQQGRLLAQFEEEATMEGITRRELEQRIAMREQNIRALRLEEEALALRKGPLENLTDQRMALEADLTDLRERMLSVHLSTSSQLSQVRVISPAQVPLYPSFPKVVINTAIGLVAGLLLSFFMLVVFDTLSGTVKTSVDLRRLAGTHALVRLSRNMIDQATGKAGERKVLGFGSSADVARDLANRLVGTGDGGNPRIQVAGFREEAAASAAMTIAAALVKQGRKVICRLPESTPLPRSVQGNDEARGLIFVHGDEKMELPDAISLECLGDRSPWSEISPASGESSTLVCAVTAGELSEEDLQEFNDSAERASRSDLYFVLLAR